MEVPLGPSVQLALAVVDELSDFTVAAVTTVWERWLGPTRIERKLKQLARLGCIKSDDRQSGGDRVFHLTPVGHQMAQGGRDPEACWKRDWDGRWRLVLFDVPEVHETMRKRLRRQLRALSFGYLQNSVWISPDPITALQQQIERAVIDVETLTFLDARPCGGETDAQLVEGAWNFPRINRGYTLHAEMLKSALPRTGGAAAKKRWLNMEWKAWCAAVRTDPLLPEILLPPAYRGREAWQRRRDRLARLINVA